MPLLNLQTLLSTDVAFRQQTCPRCGTSMELKKEIEKLGIWCRLMMRTPNIHRYYHCATCGEHYGLVKLDNSKHLPL